MQSRQVIVVGAGIVGAACAVRLVEDGHTVTIVDRDGPGEATSHGNAGVLASASIIPLSLPGTWRNLPKWLRDPEGPLSLRWTYLPRMVPWLLRFAASGAPRRVDAITDALAALHRDSYAEHRALAELAGATDLIRPDRYVHAFETEALFEKDKPAQEMRRRRGFAFDILDAHEVRQLDPALSPEVKRAVVYHDHGRTVDPGGLVKALAAHAERRGARILRAEVRGIEAGEHGVTGVVTDQGRLAADAVVVAAGPWSARLLSPLGTHVPLEVERGYHLVIEDPSVMPRHPTMSGAGKFVSTPMAAGLRIAGTVEFAGLDAPPNYARADMLLRQAKRLFPGLEGKVAARWMGNRPSLPDSLPVIGASPRFRGLYHAFGHAHTGLTAAPRTARIVADLVAGRTPPIDLSPFRVDRF